MDSASVVPSRGYDEHRVVTYTLGFAICCWEDCLRPSHQLLVDYVYTSDMASFVDTQCTSRGAERELMGEAWDITG